MRTIKWRRSGVLLVTVLVAACGSTTPSSPPRASSATTPNPSVAQPSPSAVPSVALARLVKNAIAVTVSDRLRQALEQLRRRLELAGISGALALAPHVRASDQPQHADPAQRRRRILLPAPHRLHLNMSRPAQERRRLAIVQFHERLTDEPHVVIHLPPLGVMEPLPRLKPERRGNPQFRVAAVLLFELAQPLQPERPAE